MSITRLQEERISISLSVSPPQGTVQNGHPSASLFSTNWKVRIMFLVRIFVSTMQYHWLTKHRQRRGGRRDTNNSFHLLSCLYPSFRVCIMNSLLYCFSQHWYVSEIRKKILSSSSEKCATLMNKWLNWFLTTNSSPHPFISIKDLLCPLFIYSYKSVLFYPNWCLGSSKKHPS